MCTSICVFWLIPIKDFNFIILILPPTHLTIPHKPPLHHPQFKSSQIHHPSNLIPMSFSLSNIPHLLLLYPQLSHIQQVVQNDSIQRNHSQVLRLVVDVVQRRTNGKHLLRGLMVVWRILDRVLNLVGLGGRRLVLFRNNLVRRFNISILDRCRDIFRLNTFVFRFVACIEIRLRFFPLCMNDSIRRYRFLLLLHSRLFVVLNSRLGLHH